jgi:hypothetical protein
MQQDELVKLLTDFAAQRLALLQRHEAGARIVSNYDFNNTYQYIINREETHVAWLGSALTELGLPYPPAAAEIAMPEHPKAKKTVEVATFRNILEDDARTLTAFVERWRPRVATMTHARHQTMLNVVLGESMEHQRLFAQAASGFEDLLGRRTSDAKRVGVVMPSRWQE